jgi:hypothetical protein
MLVASFTGAATVTAFSPGSVRAQTGSTTPVFPKTHAELAAAPATINLNIPSHEGTGLIFAARYSDGSPDHTTALTAALKVATQTPHSTVIISGAVSVDAGKLPFTVPSDTRVTGLGAQSTIITVTGTVVASCVFKCANSRQTGFADFTLIGNSRANAYANGAAIAWTGQIGTPLRGLEVRNCVLQNFGADYWIYVQNVGTATMREVTISGCTFISGTGNARQPRAIGADSSCIGIIGNATNQNGTVESISVTGNTANCDYIKSFFVAYRSTRFINVSNNNILNCGMSEIADDCGAYAIMLYDSANFQPPSYWNISDNTIVAPRSCGVYLAACSRGSLSGNIITGQYDQHDGSIPKGAIALNAASRVSISDNTILDCFRSISLAGRVTNVDLKSNTVDSKVPGAIGVKISGGVITNIGVIANTIDVSGAGARGIFLQSFTGNNGGVDQAQLSNNDINAASYCIEHYSPDGSYNAAHIYIRGNRLRSGAQHIRLINTANSVNISNNVFSGGTTTLGCDVSGSTRVAIQGNCFEDFSTGHALKTNHAQGVLWGNTFVHTNSPLDLTGDGEILGASRPTWAGSPGMQVQTGTPGHASTMGWMYDGSAWVPMGGQGGE